MHVNYFRKIKATAGVFQYPCKEQACVLGAILTTIVIIDFVTFTPQN